MITSQIEKKARSLAKREGYTLRRIPHSLKHPNDHVRVTTPGGEQIRVRDFAEAVDTILLHSSRKKRA